jgi:hypothetical protein
VDAALPAREQGSRSRTGRMSSGGHGWWWGAWGRAWVRDGRKVSVVGARVRDEDVTREGAVEPGGGRGFSRPVAVPYVAREPVAGRSVTPVHPEATMIECPMTFAARVLHATRRSVVGSRPRPGGCRLRPLRRRAVHGRFRGRDAAAHGDPHRGYEHGRRRVPGRGDAGAGVAERALDAAGLGRGSHAPRRRHGGHASRYGRRPATASRSRTSSTTTTRSGSSTPTARTRGPSPRGIGDHREPAWSPDGSRVAFSSERAGEGSYDIWAVEVETGELARWTSGPGEEHSPTWSSGRRAASPSWTALRCGRWIARSGRRRTSW